MKKSKKLTEIKSHIQETATEKVIAFSLFGQICETVREFCGFSASSVKLFVKFAECFGVILALVCAVRELIKEIKSPL